MNWVKENKFLTGFIVVLLIGIGVLGYEVYTASSAYDDASDSYTKAAGEYNRLRHLVPFPSKQNLQAYEAQKEEAGKVITAFEADLAKKGFPLEPISPEKFQDQLKASVTAVRAKAAENGIKLPDKFYLGFAKYETTPPSNEAAAPLSRELKAIEWVLNQYLSRPATQVHEVTSLVRNDLPEEGGAKGAGSGGRSGSGGGPGAGPGGAGRGGGPGGGPGGGGAGRRSLVQYHPFDITVICKQQALIEVLKTITGAQAPQFYVLRKIRVKNEKEKGPPRVTPDAAKPDEKQAVQYIVGEEWLDAAAQWEVVDFASPADAKTAPDQSGSAPKPGPGPKSTPAPAASLNPAAIAAPTATLIPAATPAPAATTAPAATPPTAATPAPKSTPVSQKP